MLNLSPQSVSSRIDKGAYKSFGLTMWAGSKNLFPRLLIGFLLIIIVIMFLPWTQNIRAKGTLTSLYPEDRPQTINSTIAGRVEKWYVQEGQFVKKGDTIVFLSEIKAEYFDPLLTDRQDLQVKSKEASADAYSSKIAALDNQVANLREMLRLKSEQAQNKIRQAVLKIESDSLDFIAAGKDYDIAKIQMARAKEMYDKGVISLVDFERRQMKLQETTAKRVGAENKLLASRNELLNAKIEWNNLRNEYGEKIAKSQSDRSSAQSDLFDAQGSVAKLESQLANYELRAGFYYILAPRDGYIVKAIAEGIGETIKEGEPIVSIMPATGDLAAEIYVRPMDMPLLDTGRTVRLIFDGWPAFVFSGWPGTSFGTFGGKIVAIDRVTSKENMFRILVGPDPADKPWPEQLRAGAGVNGMVLLKDVPIWFELWRQINGFPPEFYTKDEKVPKMKVKKK